MKKDKKISDTHDTTRENAVLVCPPDKAGNGILVRFFGLLCRYIVTAFAVYGLALLINDAVQLPVGSMYLFLASLVCCAWIAVFYVPKAGPAISIASAAIYVAVSYELDSDFFERIVVSLKYLYNSFLQRLVDRNFLKMAEFMVENDISPRETVIVAKTAITLVALILAASFVPFILKKTRLAFPAIISSVLIFVICTYNLSNANWAISFVIASFAAVLVLNRYDSIYIRGPQKRKNSSDLQLFGVSGEDSVEVTAEATSLKERIQNQKKRKETVQTLDDEIAGYFSTKNKKVKKSKQDKSLVSEEDEIKIAKRKEKKNDRISLSAKAAMGGFSALATFALVITILILPASLTNSNFPKIPAISDNLTLYREYLTAFLRGDDLVLDDLEYARQSANFAPRSTDAKEIKYRGVRLFKLETPNAADVYMPGWVATDYIDGSWYTAGYNSETYNKYRGLYAAVYDRNSTPSESLYLNFMSAFLPHTMNDPGFENNNIYINSAYGLIAEQVNIKRLTTLTGSQLYLPSRFNLDYNLRKYGLDTKSDLSYVNFFDGIYTGKAFEELNVEYAAVSYMTTHKNYRWVKNISTYIAEFNEAYNIVLDEVLIPRRAKISRYADVKQTLQMMVDVLYSDIQVRHYEQNTVRVEIPENYLGAGIYNVHTAPDSEGNITVSCLTTGYSYVISESGDVSASPSKDAPELPFAVRYASLMTIADKLEIASMFYDYFIYRNYVYEVYMGKAESEIITDYYNSLIDSLDPEEKSEIFTDGQENYLLPYAYNTSNAVCYENRHDLVMKIISHLAAKDSGYTYTLTPTAKSDPDLDGVENFLTVTKEGYCVQFASAAVLLLREAGIPARYVEGYIASEFTSNVSNSDWYYTSYVKDDDAHAWLEVWYDGIGWVRYEATPKYYSDAYGIKEDDPNPDDPDDTTTLPDDTTTEPTDDTTDPFIEDTLPPDSDVTTLPTDTTAPSATIPIIGIPLPSDGEWNLSAEDILRIVLFTATVLLIAILIAVAVIAISKRAEKHEQEREELLTKAENKQIAEEERHDIARKLIDMTMNLLRIYGTPPGKCEPRTVYAERISKAYLDIFGRRKKVVGIERMTKEELEKLDGSDYIIVPDTDFIAIFDSIASEEFGIDGMNVDEIRELAIFYKRLYNAMPRRVSGFARFIYKYFKFI